MSTCPACSREVPVESRYCPDCGAVLRRDGDVAVQASHTLDGGSSMLIDDDTRDASAVAADSIDHGRFVPGVVIHERYRITGRLGHGAMGEVYRADDLKLGQTVALKFLPHRLASDEVRLRRFHTEVRIAREVAHPNVCRVYDIGEYEGHTYLSMEYVDGENLASLLRRIGRLPKDKAIDVSRQLCAGLAAAHERGILHRDLKPMNVMVDGRGNVRLTDFGLAALASDLDESSARVGTPAYMSPEQLAGGRITERSDLYSLGLVLYEMFTGRKVFQANSLSELARQHDEYALSPPSKLVDEFDPAVERVILHCLERDAYDRPSSALAVSAALPGGDPLAAALAAGETPSPELVAASAHAEGIRPVVGLACLVVFLVGAIALPFLNDQVKLYRRAQIEKPPDVLQYTAQQLLDHVHFRAPRRDLAFGFTVNEPYLTGIEDRDTSPTRWDRLVLGQPPAMGFWYRVSPNALTPSNPRGIVTPDDPPLTEPGMALVELDPEGRLLALRIVPPEYASPLDLQATADWTPLLEAAGAARGRFESTDPLRVPPTFCTSRAAWTGYFTISPNVPVRIEAASYGALPVHFELVYGSEAAGEPVRDGVSATLVAERLIEGLLTLAALIGASVMARRNLMMGRSDRRGAARLATFVTCVFLTAWLLRADHTLVLLHQVQLVTAAAGSAVLLGALTWLCYVALEPHVRRRWPDMLISWNRLLAGRLRDPLVGRDIIIGGLFAIFGIVLMTVRHYGPLWLGAPPPRPAAVPDMLFLGPRYELTQLLHIVTNALFWPMLLLVVLLVFLVLLRRRWAALLGFYLLLTSMATLIATRSGANVPVEAGYYALLIGALIFVLMRFGLLALCFALFYLSLLDRYPITADLSAWYAGPTYFALGIAIALAVYGFFISIRGPLLLHRDLLRV